MQDAQPETNNWPELDWSEWQPTADTLHMWTQIVGKTRLALSPLRAHWWNVPLYVSARGLTTSAMPYGHELLEIEFDFVSHDLRFAAASGPHTIQPKPCCTAVAVLPADSLRNRLIHKYLRRAPTPHISRRE